MKLLISSPTIISVTTLHSTLQAPSAEALLCRDLLCKELLCGVHTLRKHYSAEYNLYITPCMCVEALFCRVKTLRSHNSAEYPSSTPHSTPHQTHTLSTKCLRRLLGPKNGTQASPMQWRVLFTLSSSHRRESPSQNAFPSLCRNIFLKFCTVMVVTSVKIIPKFGYNQINISY